MAILFWCTKEGRKRFPVCFSDFIFLLFISSWYASMAAKLFDRVRIWYPVRKNRPSRGVWLVVGVEVLLICPETIVGGVVLVFKTALHLLKLHATRRSPLRTPSMLCFVWWPRCVLGVVASYKMSSTCNVEPKVHCKVKRNVLPGSIYKQCTY